MSKTKIFNVAINDVRNINFSSTKCYTTWHSMIRRCYSKVYKQHKPTYNNVSMCSEWLKLSNFVPWFNENYIEGWALDKDILSKKSKQYCPDNCCFVPAEINSALIKNRTGNSFPAGVYYKKRLNKYIAQLSNTSNGIRTTIHLGCFNTPDEAFLKYKEAKEAYLKELADKWKNQLSVKAYNGIINYIVEPY